MESGLGLYVGLVGKLGGLYIHRFEGRYEMKLRACFSHQPSTYMMFISRVAVSIFRCYATRS